VGPGEDRTLATDARPEESGAVEPTRPPRLWGLQTRLGIALALLMLFGMASLIDLEAVWREIVRCHKGLAFLGLLAHYATYPVRGVRWRRTLRHLHGKAGPWRFSLLVFFYNAVDNLVPGKFGDFYAAHLARINLNVRRSAALGSIVFLRMIDAWVVLVLAFVCSGTIFVESLPESVLWALIFGGVVAAAATAILLIFVGLGKIQTSRLPENLRKRIDSFRSGMWPRPRELASIAALTAVIWGLELLWMLLLLRAFDIAVQPAELLFVTTIPLLASAFPLTPSGAGVVELSLYGCLRSVGTPVTLAASVTVLNRFIDYWLHILLGILTWAFRRRLGLRTWREVSPQTAPGAGGIGPLS
jgi:uncharacterized protein (TIRG00374 family)